MTGGRATSFLLGVFALLLTRHERSWQRDGKELFYYAPDGKMMQLR
jgi:hypothetical protein